MSSLILISKGKDLSWVCQRGNLSRVHFCCYLSNQTSLREHTAKTQVTVHCNKSVFINYANTQRFPNGQNNLIADLNPGPSSQPPPGGVSCLPLGAASGESRALRALGPAGGAGATAEGGPGPGGRGEGGRTEIRALTAASSPWSRISRHLRNPSPSAPSRSRPCRLEARSPPGAPSPAAPAGAEAAGPRRCGAGAGRGVGDFIPPLFPCPGEQ